MTCVCWARYSCSKTTQWGARTTFHRIKDGLIGGTDIAMAEHMLYDSDESKLTLDSLIAKYGHGAAYQTAKIYAWQGERQSIDWLQRAYEQRDGDL
jgi:hypothetical protein